MYLLTSMSSPALAQTCAPRWDPAFGDPGMDALVFSMVVFDDGSAPALYAGGRFDTAGGTTASGLARWDGAAWADVGGGIDGEVHALLPFDFVGGPGLVIGGFFDSAGGMPAGNVAAWDEDGFSTLGSGLGDTVYDFAVFDDGTGDALYAATDIPIGSSGGVWKLDDSDWRLVGGGLSSQSSLVVVRALAVFDDGTGPALYAAGLFGSAGGVPVSAIARWDGQSWHDVGGGLNENVFTLAVFDDGGGDALYAGGTFLAAGGVGGVPAIGFARWTGTAWENFGNDDFTVDFFAIFAMASFDDGSGPALYASGIDAIHPNRMHRWDGRTFSIATEHGANTVWALHSFDDGSGAALYMGGQFQGVEGLPAHNIARWLGCPPAPLGDFNGDGVVDVVDFLQLLAAWGVCEGCVEDLNGDGTVGVVDLLLLLMFWTA